VWEQSKVKESPVLSKLTSTDIEWERDNGHRVLTKRKLQYRQLIQKAFRHWNICLHWWIDHHRIAEITDQWVNELKMIKWINAKLDGQRAKVRDKANAIVANILIEREYLEEAPERKIYQFNNGMKNSGNTLLIWPCEQCVFMTNG